LGDGSCQLLGFFTQDSVLPNQLAAGLQIYGDQPALDLALAAHHDGDEAMAASWIEVASLGDTTGHQTSAAVQAWILAGDCDRAWTVLDGNADTMEPSWLSRALDSLSRCEDIDQ